MSVSWERVAAEILKLVEEQEVRPPESQRLDEGQRDSLRWMADRMPQSGLVLADEVGIGKTRIACAVVHAVIEAGGRAAVVVPHGLIHQWVAESSKLHAGTPEPKQLTTFTAMLRELSTGDEARKDFSPRPGKPEWCLISHGFRAPLVRSNSNVWRASLPALVGLHLASRSDRDDGRTRIGKLHRKIETARASSWEWNGIARIASEVAPKVGRRRDLRKRIEALPPLNVSSWNNDALLAQFGDGGDGRRLTEELLGLWLGDFDLLVIDEAHKSRGDADIGHAGLGVASGKVLVRLVGVLLKQPEDGRRLCLTATPMELDLSQWLELLKRARSGIDQERARSVVKRLQDAASQAAVAPDEDYRLKELCGAARDFTEALAPYVTRRRRDQDPLVSNFRAHAKISDVRSHPHRRLERVQIPWVDTMGHGSPWLDALFATECMSRSARGLTAKDTEGWPHAVRDAYTKLSAGHVSIDLSQTSERFRVPEPGTVDPHTRGKIARVAYWYQGLSAARECVHEDVPSGDGVILDPDSEHPRIVAAVKEIESWTHKREKVLVFGVFLGPLRLLRDVLNVRSALRAADAGRPIAHGIHSDKALLGIALRQLPRMRAEDAFSGRLFAGGEAEVRKALADNHKAYERLRDRMRRRSKKWVAGWRSDPSLLGELPAERDLDEALEHQVLSFVIDGLLSTAANPADLDNKHFDALTSEFVETHLRPLLSELDGEDSEGDVAASRLTALRAIIMDSDTRQSLHARLLQGSTHWESRRYLQAAFNRRDASPWVLIAQSQVGREGLNLHESCRVVVQFHAEWNPAVLEQQIGRVDRKGSLWENRAQDWLDSGAEGEPPFIEIRQLIFEGTYDAYQWDRVKRRQHDFDASLFGSLLPAEALSRVPTARLQELLAAAPSFAPPRRPCGPSN